MNNIKYLILSMCCVGAVSCDDFLNTVPDNRTLIDTPEKVSELLVSGYPLIPHTMFCEAMSDNSADKGRLVYNDISNEEAYHWSEVMSASQDTPGAFWTYCYNAIATINHAMEVIESAENPEIYKHQKGEALVARAYAHFMLVNVFAQRYNPSTAAADLGVPYITSPEKDVFVEYTRSTIAEVYEKISKDLEIGIPLIDNKKFQIAAYHFNREAAAAFATRFYLYTGEWDKVIRYSEIALGIDCSTRLRDLVAYRSLDFYEMQARYAAASEPTNLLLTSCITNVGGSQIAAYRYGMNYALSREIFERSVVPGLAYQVFGQETALNIPKFKRFFKTASINANTGLAYAVIPLFTLEEVLLNRMEAQAMLNDYAGALTSIKEFLRKRVLDVAPVEALTEEAILRYYRSFTPELSPFYEMSAKQRAFVDCATDFRRKEFIQEGMRWFDVKRFNIIVKRLDEDGNVMDELKPNDLRRAVQIPRDAIAFGIAPNPR